MNLNLRLEILLIIVGAILLIIGLTGGSIVIKKINIPKIEVIPRIGALILGIAFVISGILFKMWTDESDDFITIKTKELTEQRGKKLTQEAEKDMKQEIEFREIEVRTQLKEEYEQQKEIDKAEQERLINEKVNEAVKEYQKKMEVGYQETISLRLEQEKQAIKEQAEQQERVIRQQVDDFVRSYYEDLSQGRVQSAINKWYDPPRALEDLARNIGWFRTNGINVISLKQYSAKVKVDVTGKVLDEPNVENWTGELLLIKLGDKWKIEEMRNFRQYW